jgi:hypothetical protein
MMLQSNSDRLALLPPAGLDTHAAVAAGGDTNGAACQTETSFALYLSRMGATCAVWCASPAATN